jgi:hypothetical protein
MRIVELEKHISVRKRISRNTGLTYSVPIAFLLFLLTLGAGFFGAVLFGILVGGMLFGAIYFIRELTHRGVERKRKKLDISVPSLDVLFNREIGLLEFKEDKLIYHTLTPGGAEKDFEILLTDTQYVSVGIIKQTKIQQFIHKDVELGFILAKKLPDGIPRQFIFYNIDDAFSKVDERIKNTSKFEFDE